ncbi:hypothetical protein CYY_009792, partial [Polysphondylium violaceum]
YVFGEIHDSLKDLATTKYFYDKGCLIDRYGLFESTHNFEIFRFLWDKLIVERQLFIDYDFMDQLLDNCFGANTLEILKFLNSAKCLSKNRILNTIQWYHKQLEKNLDHCIDIFGFLFSKNLVPPEFLFNLDYSDVKYHPVGMFLVREKRILDIHPLWSYSILFNNTSVTQELISMGFVDKLENKIILGESRIGLLDILFKAGLSIASSTVEEAARVGNIDLLTYISKNTHPCPSVSFSTIISCIKAHKLSSIKNLLSNFQIVDQDQAENNDVNKLLVELGKCKHVGILKYIYENQHLFGSRKLDFQTTFSSCINGDNLIIFKYLYNVVGFKTDRTPQQLINKVQTKIFGYLCHL